MDIEFEYVERPQRARTGGRGAPISGLTAALMGTAATGQAIRFPLNGLSAWMIRNRLLGSRFKTLRGHGYRVHTQLSDDGLALCVWCMPLNGDEGGRSGSGT